MSRWALSILIMFGMIGLASAQTQPVQPQQHSENPGQTEAERWVWNEVRSSREPANLNRHCKIEEDLDPRAGDDPRWRDPCRSISAAFIERVLTEEPWRSRLPFRGLRIIGAQVSEPLDLSAARISAEVWLDQSRFEKEVMLSRARFDGLLSFDSSTFESGISAGSLQVGGDLFLSDGAVVRGGPLRLSGAKIDRQVGLNGSTFENGIDAYDLQVGAGLYMREGAVRSGPLVLRGANVKDYLDLSGSTFEGGIDADSLQVGAGFFLREGATVRGGPLRLSGAKIDRQVSLNGSTFENGIDAYFLQVGGSFFLREGATVRGGPLRLSEAKIDGQVSLNGSTFENGIDADGLQVGAALSLGEGATVRGGPLILVRAKIGGSLHLNGSTFEGGINADGLDVGADLLLRNATARQTPTVTFAQIKGTLDLSGAKLPGLDLARTTIGELSLGSGTSTPPAWDGDTGLILRGTHTKVLRDWFDASELCPDQDAWPDQLDLQGFIYEQLAADPGTDMRERAACWYESWLRRDPQLAPQPYRQLAGVLRTMGDPDRADAVLYAARERERTEAWTKGQCGWPFKVWPWSQNWPWWSSQCWEATWLGLLKSLIGYGIGSRLFLVFIWVLGFTLIGILALSFSPPARAKGIGWMFGASLDHLLPIVSLNKEFEDFFDDPKRERLKGWQLAYFAFHALFGFLLGSFVVTALAGLTQTG